MHVTIHKNRVRLNQIMNILHTTECSHVNALYIVNYHVCMNREKNHNFRKNGHNKTNDTNNYKEALDACASI